MKQLRLNTNKWIIGKSRKIAHRKEVECHEMHERKKKVRKVKRKEKSCEKDVREKGYGKIESDVTFFSPSCGLWNEEKRKQIVSKRNESLEVK